uniref:Uncharacterized protein n=1 Tax=Dunaliella tertiolecta TaxID=3047 RepID=A0A7S3R461_DUNTE
MPAHSLHSNSGAQVGSSGVQADGESGDMGAAMERHRSVDGLMHRQEDVLGPGAPLDGSDLKEQREGLEGGSWDGISEQQQQQLGGRDASFGEAPSYPYYYSEEQRRQLEEEEAQLQEHRQPISEQQRQQLQQELVDAGMTIPRGSRVVGLQTRAVARNAGEASSGPSTRASSGKVAREAGAQSSNVPEDDNAQEGEQGQQEVVVVLEEGTMSGDGEGQPKEPGMYRTHTMVLPPKHPVLTSGIQYTVVKAVGVPLLRRAEAEEGERAARMAQLEAELGAPRLARQQREGQRAGKALRRMSGTQEAPPPPPQGVSMVRTVQGRRQPSPGPREELPPQPAPFVAPPPMPIPTLATKPKGPGTNPAPKVPHALPPIRSGSDREKARTSNSNATTFGHAITDIGKAKMQDVWMS